MVNTANYLPRKSIKKKFIHNLLHILIYNTFLPLFCTLRSLKTNSSYGTKAHVLHLQSGILCQMLYLFPKNYVLHQFKETSSYRRCHPSYLKCCGFFGWLVGLFFFFLRWGKLSSQRETNTYFSSHLLQQVQASKLSSTADDCPHERRAHADTKCLTIHIARNKRIWKIQLNKKTIMSSQSHSREETLLELGEFQDI